MVYIKTDIETRKDKTDPKSEIGYWGAKSKTEEIGMFELMHLLVKRNYMGVHELLMGGKYRPYADVDCSDGITKDNFEKRHLEILETSWKIMELAFPTAKIHCWCSSGKKVDKWKVSFHFVGTGVYFTSRKHISFLLRDTPEMFDRNVYGTDEDREHLLRVPYCTKPNSQRKLRKIELKTMGQAKERYIRYYDEPSEERIADGLVTCVSEFETEMPAPAGYEEPTKPEAKQFEDKDMTDDQKNAQLIRVTKLIAALSPTRANSRESWCKGVWALRRIGQQSEMLGAYQKLAHVFAKKADNDGYDETATDNLYMAEPKEQGVGFTCLRKWADEDCPDWDLDFTIEVGEEFDIECIKAKAKAKMSVDEFNQFKDGVVDYMNRFYTLIKWGRKPFIVYETWKVNQNGEREKERDYKDISSIKVDFENKTMQITIGKDTDSTTFCPFKCWRQHPRRSEKERMYFNPKAFLDTKYADPKAYNVFDGLAIQYRDCKDAPALTKDSPWLQHILKRWCKNDEKEYENILDRFALQIQQAWIKHGVGLGLMSPDGGGKGLILETLFRIIGEKYIARPGTADQILGNFNALMEGKLIVFLDELVWGGDKEREGSLKRLVTQEYGSIERKGIDPVPVHNPANVICCSNEDWMLPAGKKARRFQVHDLDDELSGSQTAKTEKIIQDILDVDILSIAKFLYERNITGFNPKKILATDGLRSQKIASMSALDQACFKIVNSGTVKINGNDQFISGGEFNKTDFYDSVGASMKFMSDTKFWVALRKLWPSLKFDRKSVGGKKIWIAYFPTLDVMRDEFRKMYDDEGWEFDDPEEADDEQAN